jgi:hypothetical protein
VVVGVGVQAYDGVGQLVNGVRLGYHLFNKLLVGQDSIPSVDRVDAQEYADKGSCDCCVFMGHSLGRKQKYSLQHFSGSIRAQVIKK